MLPICFGEATKFSQFLLDTDKTYVVRAKLGVRTTTSDSDGDVVCEKPVSLTHAQIDDAKKRNIFSVKLINTLQCTQHLNMKVSLYINMPEKALKYRENAEK